MDRIIYQLVEGEQFLLMTEWEALHHEYPLETSEVILSKIYVGRQRAKI